MERESVNHHKNDADQRNEKHVDGAVMNRLTSCDLCSLPSVSPLRWSSKYCTAIQRMPDPSGTCAP